MSGAVVDCAPLASVAAENRRVSVGAVLIGAAMRRALIRRSSPSDASRAPRRAMASGMARPSGARQPGVAANSVDEGMARGTAISAASGAGDFPLATAASR